MRAGRNVTVSVTHCASIAAAVGLLNLPFAGDEARAQSIDDLDASITTGPAITFGCSQNLSFGTIYVAPSNALAVVTLTSGGSLSSNHASVVVTGGAVAECTIAGLQSPDTAILFLSGSGTSATGGRSGVILSDGALHTLTANILAGGSGFAVGGGRINMQNGTFPVFGTLTIPASHVDYGTYTVTMTLMVFRN
jgi:hypothetical protein